MRTNPIQRLLVEGDNDIHVITNLLMSMKHKPFKGYADKAMYKNEFVVNAGGKEKAKELIPSILDIPDLEHLGIILDADESAENTWISIRNILKINGFAESELPLKLPPNGILIQQKGKPLVGIWIMPDNLMPLEKGELAYLEHFYEQIIQPEDKFLTKAGLIIEEIALDKECNFALKDKQKAKIHTWLAWQNEPGNSMGIALKKKSAFDLKSKAVLNFIAWLDCVFEFEK
jgi:hypothetical protein